MFPGTAQFWPTSDRRSVLPGAFGKRSLKFHRLLGQRAFAARRRCHTGLYRSLRNVDSDGFPVALRLFEQAGGIDVLVNTTAFAVADVRSAVTGRASSNFDRARAFFSEIAQGESAKTVWGSMRAEQVSIAQRWRRPRSDPEYT